MLGISFAEWTFENVLIRVVASIILGAVIGIDRGVKRRGGGAKTTMTVCLGATMVMLTEQYMSVYFPNKGDSTRMAAQVISGVGFLGVGTIFISSHKIKGLTSAASIWTCASVGLATGIGFIDGAVLVTVVLLIGLHTVPWIEDCFYKHSRYMTLFIEVDNGKTITTLIHRIKDDGCQIDSYEVDKPKAKGQFFAVAITLCVPRNTNTDDYLETLREIKGIMSIDEM